MIHTCGSIPFRVTHDELHSVFGASTVDTESNDPVFVAKTDYDINIRPSNTVGMWIIIGNGCRDRYMVIDRLKSYFNNQYRLKITTILESAGICHDVVTHGVCPYIEYSFEYYDVDTNEVFANIREFHHRRTNMSMNFMRYARARLSVTFPLIYGFNNTYTPYIHSASEHSILWCSTIYNATRCLHYLRMIGFTARIMYFRDVDQLIVWSDCPHDNTKLCIDRYVLDHAVKLLIDCM